MLRCDWPAVGALATFATVAQAQRVVRMSDRPAVAEQDRITFYMPLPWEGMKPPRPPVSGFFVWRITVETRQPFSVVVMSDTALTTSTATDVLGATSLRRCADPLVESARECTEPIHASMEVERDHFRIVLHDSVLALRVHNERPTFYWRYVVEPGGRYVLTQQRLAWRMARP